MLSLIYSSVFSSPFLPLPTPVPFTFHLCMLASLLTFLFCVEIHPSQSLSSPSLPSFSSRFFHLSHCPSALQQHLFHISGSLLLGVCCLSGHPLAQESFVSCGSLSPSSWGSSGWRRKLFAAGEVCVLDVQPPGSMES